MIRSKNFGILLLVACFLASLLGSQGHGYVNWPAARNNQGHAGFPNFPFNFDRQSLSAGGPSSVRVNGFGLCGDNVNGPQNHLNGGNYGRGVIAGVYKAGEAFDIEVIITAHHKGYFLFYLCVPGESGLSNTAPETQQCLIRHLLKKDPTTASTNTNNFNDFWVLPNANAGPWTYRMRYLMPPGVNCERCTLMWYWQTGNSPGNYPEEFWNCADVQVTTSSCGTGGCGFINPKVNGGATRQRITDPLTVEGRVGVDTIAFTATCGDGRRNGDETGVDCGGSCLPRFPCQAGQGPIVEGGNNPTLPPATQAPTPAPDTNECTRGTHNCNANAQCTNTVGSFTCACNSGFSGNGVTCTANTPPPGGDVNECTAGTHNCARGTATCTNTVGSFTCACNSGYAGNGVTCADRNECTAGTHNCDRASNAICTNTAGSFTCTCQPGFTGNGVTCTAQGGTTPAACTCKATDIRVTDLWCNQIGDQCEAAYPGFCKRSCSVIPPRPVADNQVCGDGFCTSPNDGGSETCATCPQDCGNCKPAPSGSTSLERCYRGDGIYCYTRDCCPLFYQCAGGVPFPTQPTAPGTVCYGGDQVFANDARCSNVTCTADDQNTQVPGPVNGNGVCEASETCSSAPADCGACPSAALCGDGQCNGAETCATCSADCGTCAVQSTQSSRVMGGYYINWGQYRAGNGAFFPENTDPRLLSHAMYAFANMDDSYRLQPVEYNDVLPDGTGMYRRFNDHVRSLNPSIKTLISIGGFAFTATPASATRFSTMASSSATRATFINSCIAFARQHNFDGIDLDWEFPGVSYLGGAPQDKPNFTALLREFRSAISSEARSSGRGALVLTFAASAGDLNIQSAYELNLIHQYVDYIWLMTYDFHGSWESTVRPHTPLYDPTSALSIDGAVNIFLSAGVPSTKICLGLAAYGRTWTLATASANPTYGQSARLNFDGSYGGDAGPVTMSTGFVAYSEIVDNQWTSAVDQTSQTVYAWSQDQFVTYDNEDTIRAKVDYAISKNLGGAFVWSLADDDFRAGSPITRAASQRLYVPASGSFSVRRQSSAETDSQVASRVASALGIVSSSIRIMSASTDTVTLQITESFGAVKSSTELAGDVCNGAVEGVDATCSGGSSSSNATVVGAVAGTVGAVGLVVAAVVVQKRKSSASAAAARNQKNTENVQMVAMESASADPKDMMSLGMTTTNPLSAMPAKSDSGARSAGAAHYSSHGSHHGSSHGHHGSSHGHHGSSHHGSSHGSSHGSHHGSHHGSSHHGKSHSSGHGSSHGSHHGSGHHGHSRHGDNSTNV